MGRSIYFSDDELVELETALEGMPSGITDEATLESAFFKVGFALERPWALAKKTATAKASSGKDTK